MNVTFGWGYDGTRWNIEDSIGHFATGPQGLIALFATRLGLAVPETTTIQRLAAYRQHLAQILTEATTTGVQPWFAQSFSKDPWATTREILMWRDDLVASGWTGQAPEKPADPQMARLDALARVETALQQNLTWPKGHADVLRDVVAELQELAASPNPYTLGVERLQIEHAYDDLPNIWQHIFKLVAALQVDVVEVAEPQPLERLRIFEANTVWDATALATRVLQAHAHAPFTLIAGSSTKLLDAELTSYGLSTAGIREQAGIRPGAQIVPVFLTAVTAPHDIHALAALLDLPLAVRQGKDGIRRQIRLFPNSIRQRLLRALSTEAGIGGNAWQNALTDIREQHNEQHTKLVKAFDHLIRKNPLQVHDFHLATADVIEHLGWLTARLNALHRGLGATAQTESIDVALAHARTLQEVLPTIGERITLHELETIIQDAAGQNAVYVDATQQCASDVMDVVTSPAQLGVGNAPVVWWLPFDDAPVQRAYTRSAELTYLTSVGVEIADPETLAALQLQSQIRSARRRGSLTAIVSTSTESGEPLGQHPLLTFLLDDMRSKTPGDSLEYTTQKLTCQVEETYPAETHIPQPVELPTRNPVRLELTPGEHLVPDNISYTTWDTLLTHPTDWLFKHQLQIKPAERTQIPSNARMTGLWFHAAVETLVNEYLPDEQPGLIHLTDEHIRARLTELIPIHASELLLPGQGRRRATLIEQGTGSISTLFGKLVEAGTKISGVETWFTTRIPATRGKDGKPLGLRGLRDLDVVLPDGRRGVIDMKYARSKTAYQNQIQHGTALQLVVYAHSITEEQSGTSVSLDRVPTAYFLLRDARFVTGFNGFGSLEVLELQPKHGGAGSAVELWDRAVTGVNLVFDRLREGVMYDFGKLVERREWQDYEKALAKGQPTATPQDANLLADLQVARDTGFIPERAFRDQSYDLITGVKEL